MSNQFLMLVTNASQTGGESSFVGGLPRLPVDMAIPVCGFCGAVQSFFFQVAFPRGHAWAGLSVATFACTGCVDKDHLIPEMVSGRLRDAEPATSFLRDYQRNFRFVVFASETGVLRSDYAERVRFRPIELASNVLPGSSTLGLLGGSPVWLMEDEYPRSIGPGEEPIFLCQLFEGGRFELVPDAPRQMELAIDGSPARSPDDCYDLFLGNALYLFGAPARTTDAIYALTQTT